jgi:hypothetical protein
VIPPGGPLAGVAHTQVSPGRCALPGPAAGAVMHPPSWLAPPVGRYAGYAARAAVPARGPRLRSRCVRRRGPGRAAAPAPTVRSRSSPAGQPAERSGAHLPAAVVAGRPGRRILAPGIPGRRRDAASSPVAARRACREQRSQGFLRGGHRTRRDNGHDAVPGVIASGPPQRSAGPGGCGLPECASLAGGCPLRRTSRAAARRRPGAAGRPMTRRIAGDVLLKEAHDDS